MRKRGKFSKRSVFSFTAVLFGLLGLLYFQKDEAYRLWTEATGKEADLVVVVGSDAGNVRPIWANLAQGGEDLTANMIEPVKGKISEAGVRSIRIDHIYDGYGVVNRGEGGELVFDWERLDGVVNSIIDAGAVPMLSLSYMPLAISSGDIVAPPRDWQEWKEIVKATVEHYAGELAIADIAYEVWNEPDLFGGWSTSEERSYLEMYKWAVVGAEEANTTVEFEIGGPAVTNVYTSWVDDFLKFVEENKLRIDFVSWHRYSKDIVEYRRDVDYILGIVSKYPKLFNSGVSLYLTEAGPNSENDEAYDGSLGAAHLVGVTKELLLNVQRVYSFEITDGKDPGGDEYWGRWGVLTHPDFGTKEKPRFKALQMLSGISGKRLLLFGEGTWVRGFAVKDDGVIKVVVVNYDEYGKHIEDVPLTFEGVEDSEYKVIVSLLGGGVEEKNMVVNAGKFSLNLKMPPNGVMMVEVVPE